MRQPYYTSRIKHRLGGARGFTLIEEVMGIFIVALLVVMVVVTFPMSWASSKINGNYAQAISLAQHKVDQMRAVGYGRLNYNDLEDAEVIDTNPSSQPFEFDSVDQLSSYLPRSTGTITITDQGSGMRKVQVNIVWQATGKKQTAGSYSLVALIGKE